MYQNLKTSIEMDKKITFVTKSVRYSKTENRVVTAVKLDESAISFFAEVNKEILKAHRDQVFDEVKSEYGSHDVGSCIMGAGLEVLVFEPRKRNPSRYKFVGQITQGSITNERFFKVAKNTFLNLYPEFDGMISINYGMLD